MVPVTTFSGTGLAGIETSVMRGPDRRKWLENKGGSVKKGLSAALLNAV
jgi:hypothetical protein